MTRSNEPAATRHRASAVMPSVVHDLRGALNTVSGYAQLLALHYPNDARIQHLKQSVDRLGTLITNVEDSVHAPK